MEIGIVIVIFSMVALYVAMPFLVHDLTPEKSEEGNRENLLARKRSLLDVARDLQADHRFGKLDSGDYERMYAETLHEGAQIVKELEDLNPDSDND